ncbi:MAG: hypothetical protein R3F49_07835 [Planctomycetota bacterium]
MKTALLILFLSSTLTSTSLRAQTCAGPIDLGTLQGGSTYSEAFGVSADGSVIVGVTNYATNPVQVGFRWTAAGGMHDIGALGLDGSKACRVSADGNVVVGASVEASGVSLRAIRWSTAGGLQDLGTLGGLESWANGVSADGGVVVGRAQRGDGAMRAFRWTAAGGMQDLGTLGGLSSGANATSADGSVVVGWVEDASGFTYAFRWTAAGGMQDLGLTPGSEAIDVSDDGTVVVGNALSPFSTTEPFRWTAAGGAQSITPSLGRIYRARAVSADGRVVVGYWTASYGITGSFRWTASAGLEDLDPLVGLGRAEDVSADGSVVVGASPLFGSPLGAFRFQSTVLGEAYTCPGVTNSTGCGGTLLVQGDPRLATGRLELTAALLPRDCFGFFLTSRTQDFVAAAGGSQGNLCLGGSIGRFVGSGQIMDSGANGTFSLTVDLNAVPAPTLTGTVAVQPGDTWNFQAWHRDTNPGPTSNFTDAVSVTFQS